MVNNFAGSSPDIANSFYQQYLVNLLGDILYVLTDADHKSGMFAETSPVPVIMADESTGFKNQIMLMARLISLVESGAVQAPLYDPATVSDSSMSNATYLRQYIADLLSNAFQNMQPYARSL
jgi:exportin-1